jgi:hypothetical protein
MYSFCSAGQEADQDHYSGLLLLCSQPFPLQTPRISAHCPVFNPKWTLWPLTNPRLHLKWFCGELKCTLVE